MLTLEENERMCRVGPATPMGSAMRRYWLPALLSGELPEADCAPVHVELLGENFVAFRDTNGDVGFMNELCCHRGASLVLGRVEECGIRCIYHGWKFAKDGSIMETPNLVNQNFRSRVKAAAYDVQEAGGIIWVYIGDPERRPRFPKYRFFDVDARNRAVSATVLNCNYVQILEGLIDSSHLNILHADAIRSRQGPRTRQENLGKIAGDTEPRLEVQNTAWGFQYAATREAASGDAHVRVTAVVAPNACFIAPDGTCSIVVPMSDERSLYIRVFWDADREIGVEPERSEYLRFYSLDDESLVRGGVTRTTCMTPSAPSRANRYHQNRSIMADGSSFSGLGDFGPEDAAVCLSMGGIYDRASGEEHIVPADSAIVRLRRMLLHCAGAVEKGAEPIGLNVDVSDARANAGDITAGESWSTLVPRNQPVDRWS